ncbi:mechanosensitive ion channel domain-containing protein [Hyphobacterium sp. HN65]|uniref:Small-conductance mechanosensitive channel n=1 Tax=Hyphobacterium lacteum TaxID=3116575 RepID=A0ABU7LNF7_9PROT|nr:mechanosensitive ion channel domain-containing protein [Hyphobacterium sp. HN65]MEE2525417.1 mechanosensitive ion channel domain-containing protein [Hyphobacterium sp. HN65]
MEQFFSDNEALISQITQIVTEGGVNLILAIGILIVGYMIAGAVKRAIVRMTEKNPAFDRTLATFFASMARYGILVVVFIAVLNRFGVETTSLVAAIGAAAFAVGLALQGTLSNVASGVMLVFFRPYSLGDFVEVAGVSGTVKDINLFTTELATPDNKTIIVPNGQAWGGVITNYTVKPTRRVDITFSISYDDDIDKAMKVIRDHYEADERVHKDPETFIGVIAHGSSSIDIVVRAWTDTTNYWPVYFDAMKSIKQDFDKNDIEIPYPHQVEIQRKA